MGRETTDIRCEIKYLYVSTNGCTCPLCITIWDRTNIISSKLWSSAIVRGLDRLPTIHWLSPFLKRTRFGCLYGVGKRYTSKRLWKCPFSHGLPWIVGLCNICHSTRVMEPQHIGCTTRPTTDRHPMFPLQIGLQSSDLLFKQNLPTLREEFHPLFLRERTWEGYSRISEAFSPLPTNVSLQGQRHQAVARSWSNQRESICEMIGTERTALSGASMPVDASLYVLHVYQWLYVSHQLQDLGGVSFNIDNIYSGLPRSLGAI